MWSMLHKKQYIVLSNLRIPPFHWWRTVFYLIPAITLYTIVLGAASIVSSLFDRRGYFAHACARAWSWLILKTTGVRVAVEGLERITPGTTYVFVSNHQSIYDTPVIFASLPYQLRIIAKESLARFPVLGWHLRRGGHLFVDRRHPDRAGILRRWRALVSEGLSLMIYAEGTRSPDGHVAPLQGRQLPAGDRGRTADRAAGGHRHAAGDAEGTAADRAGRRDGWSSTIRFSRRRSRRRRVHDAKALADRSTRSCAAVDANQCRSGRTAVAARAF